MARDTHRILTAAVVAQFIAAVVFLAAAVVSSCWALRLRHRCMSAGTDEPLRTVIVVPLLMALTSAAMAIAFGACARRTFKKRRAYLDSIAEGV